MGLLRKFLHQFLKKFIKKLVYVFIKKKSFGNSTWDSLEKKILQGLLQKLASTHLFEHFWRNYFIKFLKNFSWNSYFFFLKMQFEESFFHRAFQILSCWHFSRCTFRYGYIYSAIFSGIYLDFFRRYQNHFSGTSWDFLRYFSKDCLDFIQTLSQFIRFFFSEMLHFFKEITFLFVST